jgi:PKD repeat protein
MAPTLGPGVRPVPGGAPRMGQPLKPGLTTRKPPNPKKLIYGCTGCFGAALLFFVIFVLIFAAQTTAAGDNPLAKSLGVDTATFINTLNTIVNLVFLGLEVILFLLITVGLFRYFMARKDDKDAKKRGLSLAGVSFLLLLFFGGIWIGIILFMDTKKVRVTPTKTASGIVTEPPVTLGLTAPITIKFDGSKLPIDTRTYDILSYMWSFGDGGTSTVSTTSHTYKDKGANNGRYDVTLQVVKRSKAKLEESTDTYTTTVTIANVKLDAVLTATPESGPAPLEVSFDASGSSAPAGEISAYEWDFNNDNNFTDATGVSVTHTFEQLGTYTVNLRVTDNTGQFAVVSKDITVASPDVPTPVIDIPSDSGEYLVGVQYSFKGDKSTSPNGDIQKYEWDFGDGSPSANTRTATHVYRNAGTYTVILRATDQKGESGQATKEIDVKVKESAPIAVITSVPPPAKADDGFISGTVPFEVSFDGSKSTDSDKNIVDYKWDFDGDGTDDAAGEKATYVYKKDGSFNATLTVIDAENNESRATLVVKVAAQPLQARLVANPVEGVIPLVVTFDASSSTYENGQIVSYEWDFGDGSPKRIDVAKVTYKYTKIGTFTAKVTAIASDNSKSTAETPVNVRPVALTACFTPSAETGSAPLTVEFDPKCSAGTVAKTSWDFGDGETSKTRKPTHTFNNPGSYEVTLEVADNQNVIDTFSKSILVTGPL